MADDADRAADAVLEWIQARGAVFEGDVPTRARDAAARFVCHRIAGGCEINGTDCAHRHLLAAKRHAADLAGAVPRSFAFEPLVHLSPRCDRTCADCPAGAARVKLLKIGPINWRRRIIAGSAKRKKRASKMDITPDEVSGRIGADTFTSIEVGRELSMSKFGAAKWLHHWHKLNRIKRVGKRGRWWVYSLTR